MVLVHLHVHGACPCPCFKSMLNVHVSVHVHAGHHRCVCVFVCINAGMPDQHPNSPVPDWKKLTMPEQVWYRTKFTQSGIFLVRYRTKIWHAGMPMPASVSLMPMPSYDHIGPKMPMYSGSQLSPGHVWSHVYMCLSQSNVIEVCIQVMLELRIRARQTCEGCAGNVHKADPVNSVISLIPHGLTSWTIVSVSAYTCTAQIGVLTTKRWALHFRKLFCIQYTRWLIIQTTRIYGTMVHGEVVWVKYHLMSCLFADCFLQPPLSPPVTRIRVAGSLFTLLSLHHPFSVMALIRDFMGSLTTVRRSLRKFRMLSRRPTVTKPWRECRWKQLSKTVKERKPAAVADQRNLNAKASITDIAAEVENDLRETARNSLSSWGFD